jgi:DNA sulfur modification protein DndD
MENEPFPIVMDTAFARLSSKHRENIADIFPEIADQLVLFVTDEELHGKARANLESRIGAEYELHFTKEDSLTSTTTIKRIQ